MDAIFEMGLGRDELIALVTYDICRTACRDENDQRLASARQEHKVDLLTEQLCDLCNDRFSEETPLQTTTEKVDFNFLHELVRMQESQELFTFVLHPEASGTKVNARWGKPLKIAKRFEPAKQIVEPSDARFS